ncbi:MAG: hypothetical protein WAO35_22690 [Terriglobia bacterium]
MDQYSFYLWFQAIPFICLTAMYFVVTISNAWQHAMGEIKFILPADILLKVFAVLMLVSIIFVLAVLKVIQEATVSALLGSIGTGAIGIVFTARKDDSK